MSLHALTWALYGHHKNLDPTARLVLVVMADKASDDHLAWPSWATLAQGAGVSRATVARRVRDLEDTGLITQVPAEQCPAAWAHIPTDRRPKAYRLAVPGSQVETPRGLRIGGAGSQKQGYGVSAVRPDPNNPKDPGAATPTPPPWDSQTVYRERAEAAHVDHAAHITRIRQQLAAEQLQREAGMAL